MTLVLWYMPVIPAPGRLDGKFEPSLGWATKQDPVSKRKKVGW
jgi:hypothetical protein